MSSPFTVYLLVLAAAICAEGCPAGTGPADPRADHPTTSQSASKLTRAWEFLALPTSLRAVLGVGAWSSTPRSFRVITLSFLADGCVAEAQLAPDRTEAARACVERAWALALETGHQPYRPMDDDGLWLTHANLILGAGDALGPCLSPEAHQRISEALARRSLRDPTQHVASYTALPNRWPADQTATLAALARFDRAHRGQLLDRPAQVWRERIFSRAMNEELQLPWSEVTGADAYAREPRGCALSWQTRYLHEFDDALARAWWGPYRRLFLTKTLGFTGFREWAPEHDHGMDGDSGPIFLGLGAAATGLGIAAARAMGDDDLAETLEATVSAGSTIAALIPGATGPLPDAIRYLGRQLRRKPSPE